MAMLLWAINMQTQGVQKADKAALMSTECCFHSAASSLTMRLGAQPPIPSNKSMLHQAPSTSTPTTMFCHSFLMYPSVQAVVDSPFNINEPGGPL